MFALLALALAETPRRISGAQRRISRSEYEAELELEAEAMMMLGGESFMHDDFGEEPGFGDAQFGVDDFGEDVFMPSNFGDTNFGDAFEANFGDANFGDAFEAANFGDAFEGDFYGEDLQGLQDLFEADVIGEAFPVTCKKSWSSSPKCGGDNFCVGYESNGKVYCYGSNSGCKWGQNDCSRDSDCKKYNSGSAKFANSDKVPCTANMNWAGWRAAACTCKAEAQPLRVLGTKHVLGTNHVSTYGKYFNFWWSDLRDMLGHRPINDGVYKVKQCRFGHQIWVGQVKLFNGKNGGKTGNAHGRREPYGHAAVGQWASGDKIVPLSSNYC